MKKFDWKVFLMFFIIIFIILIILFLSKNNHDNIEKSILGHKENDSELISSLTYKDDILVEFSKYKRVSSKNSKKNYIVFKGEEIIKDKTSYWVRITGKEKRENEFKEVNRISVYEKNTLFGKSYYVYIDGEVKYTRIKK